MTPTRRHGDQQLTHVRDPSRHQQALGTKEEEGRKEGDEEEEEDEKGDMKEHVFRSPVGRKSIMSGDILRYDRSMHRT